MGQWHYRREEVLEEWELLRSDGQTVPQAAARMGMSTDALVRALDRARVDGDPRARFTYEGVHAAIREERHNRRTTLTAVGDPAMTTIDDLLEQGAESAKGRTRNLTVKIRALLDDLGERLEAEAAEARAVAEQERAKAEALAKVRELEEELAAAREAVRRAGGTVQASPRRRATPPGRGRDTDYKAAEVRQWAKQNGVECPARGRFLPVEVVAAWREATQGVAA